MNSREAQNILREMFPKARIQEVAGNPNPMGWFLFLVDGLRTWVDENGCVIEELPPIPASKEAA
jgi:hypothetical protein